jgi:membrane protease YdiL (CAAX protease family)
MAVVVVALMVAVYARVTPRWLGMGHVATYFGWAALQQLLMLGVVATRLERLLRSRFIVVLVVAVLFALAHAPNGWLMQFCLAAELWWCWRFLRRPVLLPVALAHALAGLLLESVLPGLPLRSLEIGARFLT